jgi:hypothetical protein
MNTTNTPEHMETTYTPKKAAGRIALGVHEQPYAWPGGYPLFAITDDGAAICPACCGSEIHQIDQSSRGDGWRVIASDINWEDADLYCDHCSKRIASAYAEPDETPA